MAPAFDSAMDAMADRTTASSIGSSRTKGTSSPPSCSAAVRSVPPCSSSSQVRRGKSTAMCEAEGTKSCSSCSLSLSESAREVYVFKHGFLSMRRIDAKSRKARAVLVRFSKSLASRRHLPSQANVLSTTHRLGMASKPTAASHRLTISVSRWGKIFFRARSNAGPWYPPSAKSFFRNGNLPNKAPRTRTPPSRSWILAGCAIACGDRPTASTRMWRFLPLIFLPAS